jgi:hypothetical protein
VTLGWGTIEVDAARVVGAVGGEAKSDLVQTGEGWCGPIEKSRTREGLWLPSSTQLDPVSFPSFSSSRVE